MDLKALAEKFNPYQIEMRRYFHAHPEASTKEVETAKKIREELTRAVIDAEEMTYLDGGASSAYQSFLDVGKVFNYIARIFSGASSIINNVNVIYQSFVSLNSLLTSFGK